MISVNEKKAHISGNAVSVFAEACIMLYFLQEQLEEEYGKEAAYGLMKELVKVIEPGNPLREEAKKSRRD